MSYLRPFLRLVVIGTVWQADDFTFSLSYIGAVPGFPGAPPTEVPQAVIAAVETYWAQAPIGSQARLYSLKLNQIGVDGRYTEDETVRHDYVASGIPGTGPNSPAPQIAYAVTLQTGRPLGRAARGRFYVPLPSSSLTVGGYLASGTVEQWRDHTDTFLESLNAAIPGWQLGVVSDIGAGYENRVEYGRYGRVLDTIRSRRNNIEEMHIQGAPLPAP
jgi:hypothetical protein